VRIVGHLALGTGFTADGSVLLSDEGFRRVCSYYPRGEANLGLVTLDQGARLDAVVARLKEALPEDVEVVPRTEVIRREVDRWVNETAIGVVFQFGVVVAMIVGAAIVYQVLSSDVSSHLAEYATLKAIGYSGRFLAGVVLQQAIALAALGFLPALLIAEGLYALTRSMASLPIEMSFGRVVFVLALSVAMCMLSGLGALRKLRTADPADLF
jgi:putative ABC transport system permease protein